KKRRSSGVLAPSCPRWASSLSSLLLCAGSSSGLTILDRPPSHRLLRRVLGLGVCGSLDDAHRLPLSGAEAQEGASRHREDVGGGEHPSPVHAAAGLDDNEGRYDH